MTLKDFFTVTELKDGFTTPTRVNELVTVIQNQKENIETNVTELSAVANTIAATENKECLDLFIQLDGLMFIDKWLNKVIYDTENGSFEEMVIAFLCALEKLQVDHHRLVGSGIGLTVQGLVGHSSLVVQEKAKDLCDKWGSVQNVDEQPTDVNSGENINSVQQETDKEEIVRQEVVMESGTETVKVENEKFKSESGDLMETSGSLEDVKENVEVDSLTTLTSNLEHKALTSTTDVDHAMESVTNTVTVEVKADKDEVKTASGDGGLQESRVGENSKSKSSSDSETDEEDEKKDGMESDDDDDDLGSRSPLSKPLIKSQNEDLISKRPSDMELDYGMVDPLELARQVAIEVELEVDSQEQSCSTSTNVNEHQSSKDPGHEVSSGPVSGPGSSPKGSPKAPEPMKDSETIDKPTLNPEKGGFSGFDLNQELSFDEIEPDRLADPLLTPISVVSASRPTVAVDGPPVAPLQFEGTLGFKGAASTSAFRRIPEGEITFSSSSSHSNSNPRLNRFEFDLNVSEGGDEKTQKTQEFLSQDKIDDPSRMQLDLNSLGDSDASIVTLDWKRDTRVASMKQTRAQSPSISSSVDLNLNDHFAVQNTAVFNSPFLGKLFNNKRDESVISIFGTQVEVNRNDNNIPPPHHNGRVLEPSIDFNLGRPGPVPGPGLGLGSSMPYSNLPAYGYNYNHNGFSMGPMYGPPGGPIPYMVDSRGAPIIPPIQPIQPIPTAFSQPTQPFFFNMGATGAPSGSNGAGPSMNVNTLELNSGFITERVNRENNNNIGLRQFFSQNQASSSSVIGGKREQPDTGFELFPTNYKHQQPPWQ